MVMSKNLSNIELFNNKYLDPMPTLPGRKEPGSECRHHRLHICNHCLSDRHRRSTCDTDLRDIVECNGFHRYGATGKPTNPEFARRHRGA